MQLNYFYNTGSQRFKELLQDIPQQKLTSFWTGEKFRSFINSTSKKISVGMNLAVNSTLSLSSAVSSVAYYPVEQFFSDSLNYSISRLKEIKQDLAINPVSTEFEKTVTTSKFNFKKFAMIGAATLTLQMGSTFLHNNNDTDSLISKDYTSLVSNASIDTNTNGMSDFSNINYNKSSLDSPFTAFIKQSLTNSNPVENLRQDIPASVVKLPKYMQSMFKSKDEAFLRLLNVAEGKQDKFYRDNKGIAIAYGWNPTRNTKEFNLKIAQEAGLDEQQTAAIVKVSNTNKVNFVPKDLKKMKLSSEQVEKTALALMPHYEQEFLDAMAYNSIRSGRNAEKDIAAYNDLPNNQQAVMIHMAYKVGGDNLINYKTFYKKLYSYLDKPNKSNLSQVQKNFQYTYATLDGQRLHDTRVEDIHTGFFADCSISVDPKSKEKVSSKINECRNIANITNKDSVKEIKTNVAGIQTKMAKMFG